MLHSVAPTGGFTAQHPLPSWLLEGPPDSPQAQIPQVGPEGRAGGDLPQPPAPFLLIFQEIPNHYWLSQKIKSINTPKLRKNKRGGVGWWHWRKSHSARPAKADNRSVPLPPFPFLIGKGPTPLPGPQGRLWPACPLKQLFFSRKTENQENSTEAEEKQPLFGAPVVFRGPWALVAGGRPEFAVGVLSAAPPVCKVHVRHLHCDLNLKRVREPAEKGWGRLPHLCSEPSGKTATYLELGKVGGEGSSVEGGVTEEEVGRCELNRGGRNTTQGHGVWKTMVRNEILKKPRRMLDREGGASCGAHRLPSCLPALLRWATLSAILGRGE